MLLLLSSLLLYYIIIVTYVLIKKSHFLYISSNQASLRFIEKSIFISIYVPIYDLIVISFNNFKIFNLPSSFSAFVKPKYPVKKGVSFLLEIL